MTYLGFHLRLTLPLLAGLAALALPTWTWRDTGLLGVVLAIVVLFTGPWDDWAVARGIWGFPPDRVRARIRHLPVEEVAFFVIQTLQGVFLTQLLRPWLAAAWVKSLPQWELAGLTFTVWMAALAAFHRRFWPRGWAYLGHLLFWFAPVVLLQWCIGGVLLGAPALVLAVTFGLGGLLTVFDVIAIRAGIWFFDPAQVLGIEPVKGLPVEEALFFLITSLLVAQSWLLFV